MPDEITPTKVDLRYADKHVVFRVTDSCVGRHYSLCELSREQLERLLNRLKVFEQLTWAQLAGRQRDVGLTCEAPGGVSFDMIHEQNTSPEKLLEQYYFHIRIEPRGTFRVFGYQKGHYFFITHVDPDGRIHNH